MIYAAYGSNLHPLRLSLRTPSAKLLGTDILIGRKLVFHKRSDDGSSKCTIIEEENENTYVAIYSINDGEKHQLDQVEEVGHGYNIAEIALDTFGTCLIYIGDDKYIDESINPYTWYKELVLVGCEYHEFSSSYIQQISNVPAKEDPNQVRHKQNMSIVVQAKNDM